MLATRTCKSNEILSAYFLIMKEIAQRANIDDASLMHYVINVIQDSNNNEAILFGCHTLTEFKYKLQI